ncbi:reverse transcriptase domain-containing protein, partial [Klebsiella pneumoniae]
NIRFDEIIKEFGFIKNVDEPCIYKKVSGSAVTFLILYVDDVLLIGNDIPMLQSVKVWLSKNFTMKDLGEASYILGMKIDQILMSGQSQSLATIPEGDEDVIIDNPEAAASLFQNFRTRDGNVVTLYHQDKRVQQLMNRKALDRSKGSSSSLPLNWQLYCMTDMTSGLIGSRTTLETGG